MDIQINDVYLKWILTHHFLHLKGLRQEEKFRGALLCNYSLKLFFILQFDYFPIYCK